MAMSSTTAAQPPPVVNTALDSKLFKLSSANKRNIPEAIFIDNVEALCKEWTNVEVLARLQELYSKYQYMQSSLLTQRSSLKTKMPDISSALETVTHLVDQRDKGGDAVEYTYQLSENIFSRAAVAPSSSVCLWLGANVMLEYTLEEAVDLLTKNGDNAKTTLASVEEDMCFLRDQITTSEVNIARTHNYGVKLRQSEKANAELEGGSAAKQAPAALANASAPPKSFSPPVRGGEGKGYTWKQEKEEIEVSVPVPDGAKKNDVKVTILQDSMKVEHAGKVILSGEFTGKVSPGGSTWTMKKGSIEISLEKADAASQWQSLFETA